MSYQVLARKWRPATFEQVVGQSHVLHALTNALSQNRLHHAYLFTGTRGVGKTSLARLFAKGLNCEQGVTATPCGQCASCVEIAQGRFVDLIEVDAASRTKVDDTRELLDNVQYRPTRGRFKVYLIDEVHMLSRSSFNALLKTLEEPPEHVKFLLATTDPQRLPVTVLSRCLQFNLKSLTLDEICVQLGHILAQEQVGYDDGAVKLLAKAANGSMRDALSLTDQAIAFGAGQVRLTQVQTMLGTIDEHHVIVLLKALCDGDVDQLMKVTGDVLSFGADPHEVLRSLLELLHQITLTQFAPSAAQLSQYAEQIKAFAKQLRPEQVQLYYQLLLNGRQDLPHAPDPKSGLEMALLRAIAFVPEAPVQRWMGEAGSEILLPEPLLPEPGKGEDVAPISAKPDETVKPVKPAASVSNSQGEVEAEVEEKTKVEEKAKIEASSKASAAMFSQDDAQATAEQTKKLNDTDGPIEADLVEADLVAADLFEADSAEQEELEEDEGALDLFAEQQLILSQAQSQGHSPELSTNHSPEPSTEPVSSLEPSSQETSSANKSPVSEASADSKADVSTSAATAQGGEAVQPSELKMPAETVEQTASIAEQAASSANESGSFYDDLYFSSDGDESGDPSDYEAYLAYQQGQDSQASGDISSSAATRPVDNSAQASASVNEDAPHGGLTPDTASPNEETTSNLLEDDLLDAVLNARQSLLSDLEEDAAKEDAAKESASKKPLVGAKKPGANQVQPSSEQLTGEENKFGAEPYVPPKRPEQAALSGEKAALSGNDEAPSVGENALSGEATPQSFGETAQNDQDNALSVEAVSNMTAMTEPGTDASETQNNNSAQQPTAYLNDEDRPPWVAPEPSQQAVTAPSDDAPNLAGQVDTQSESHARADAVAQTEQGLDARSLEDHSSDDQSPNESAAFGNHPVQRPAAQESSASSAVTEPVSQTTRVAFVTDEITGHDTDLKWYRLMSALEIGGRVRQLAVNAVCQAFSEPLPLVLKPNQKHLAAPGAITQLEDALSKALGGSCQVAFSVGVEPERETPLEIRQRFHRELLEQAHQGLLQDENIQWLTQMMQAEMEPDSLSYLPELLGKRGQTIALIDKSNFVATEES
ncbi:DNA polymerase III subunit gamma/tau [Shewanella aegiceratis]|uniref:DNA polymerase III subunit gamma/tau n=1 Tax=Shewanella aegiceratis TaxID=2864203 RepID=UPI001C65B2A2|nr:DNA polymerase III subunit gamma/tau [Shewanella aegiceratis]QYJ80943.1 DNA polymerase III subunit gamma/tau [Shewanella aegiceratis]